MNILVLLKQTFDTEEQIEIEDGKVSEEDMKFVINPYDEYAVEEGVQIKEKYGGEVSVVTFGPERSEEALRTAQVIAAIYMSILEQSVIKEDISKVVAGFEVYKRKESMMKRLRAGQPFFTS